MLSPSTLHHHPLFSVITIHFTSLPIVLCHHYSLYITTHCVLVITIHFTSPPIVLCHHYSHYPLFSVITIHFTSLPIVICYHYLHYITTHCSCHHYPLYITTHCSLSLLPIVYDIIIHCSLSSPTIVLCYFYSFTIHSLFYITTHCLYHIFVMTIHCYLSPQHTIPLYVMTHCPMSSLPIGLSSITSVHCNYYLLFSIISSHCSMPSQPLPTVHHYPLFCHHDLCNNGPCNYMDYVMIWTM